MRLHLTVHQYMVTLSEPTEGARLQRALLLPSLKRVMVPQAAIFLYLFGLTFFSACGRVVCFSNVQ
jgi:hypothetical protein